MGAFLSPGAPANAPDFGRPLDNNTSNVSQPYFTTTYEVDSRSPEEIIEPAIGELTRAQLARRERYANRAVLWDLSNNKRVQKCGRIRISETVDVRLSAEGRAHFTGLALCGRVWACPCCANKIALGRAAELQQLLEQNVARGGSAIFQTFTIPHDFPDELRPMAKVITRIFRRLLQGRSWQRVKRELGIDGQVRALEVTHGGNGFHPHSHALFISDVQLTEDQVAAFGRRNFEIWCEAVQRAGYRAPRADLSPAELVRSSKVGEYVAKFGAALELAYGGSGKLGRRGSRTPWQILSDFRETGDARDLQLWRAYECGMRGLKQLTWSPGLKKRFGIGDPTDQELAEAEVGGEIILQLESAVWFAVSRVAHGPAMVLEAAERGGADAAEAVVRALIRRWWRGDRLPLRIAEGVRKRAPPAISAA